MAILLQSDDFGRTGALGANWTESSLSSGVPFELDGDRALAPREYVQAGISGGNPVWAAGHARAVFTTFDPGIVFPLSQFSTSQPGPTQRLTASLNVTMPGTLPSPSDELRASVVVLASASAGTLAAFEFQYAIDATGDHLLRVVRRLASGTEIVQTGSVRNLTTLGVALSASESATLYARIVFNNLFVFELHTWWESPTAAASPFFGANFHSLNLSWPVQPPAANPGPGSATFYCGMLAIQEGPASGGGNTAPPVVSDRLKLDNFQVTDDRDVSALELFTIPTAAPAVSLTRVPLSGTERQTTATGLTIQPSYAVPITPQRRQHEHRTDDGFLITHVQDEEVRRSWALSWQGLTDAEMDTLRALFIDAEGTVKDFTWTIEGTDETVYVRCVEPPEIVHLGPGAWAASAVVEEVRA